MALLIETRVPFLDHRPVEFCHSRQDEDPRVHADRPGYILRASLEGFPPKAIARQS